MSDTSDIVMNDPMWAGLASCDDVADAVMQVFGAHGNQVYSEAISQIDHALQAATLATEAGRDASMIAAAFLHDFGHLLLLEHLRPDVARTEDLAHEVIGSQFLARWFESDVTQPIALHVPAKRYLCAVEPEYFDTLSPTSVRTLELQGGPMSEAEAERFAGRSGAMDAVELRRWDDLAKVPGAETIGLEAARAALVDALASTGLRA